jgi:hypothetical protein
MSHHTPLSRVLWLSFLLAAALYLGSSVAMAQGSYHVRTSVFGSAGSPGSGGGIRSNGTLGQPTAIGIATGDDNTLYAGFWKSGWLAIVTGDDNTPTARNELFQNYPNPFNPATTISFSIDRAELVRLTVYDVTGRRIRTLVDGNRNPGRYSETWDGRNDQGRQVATGIYFYRLRAGSFSDVKKMVLIR